VQAVVVVVLHVRLDTAPQLLIGGEAHAVDDVRLEGVEEGLHVCVVAGGAAAGHALAHSPGAEPVAKLVGGVLAPAIAVEDKTAPGIATTNRGVEGGAGEKTTSLRRQAPAKDAPGVLVHDHGQVTPMPAHGQIGDIADPDLVPAAGPPAPNVIGVLLIEVVQPWIGSVNACQSSS